MGVWTDDGEQLNAPDVSEWGNEVSSDDGVDGVDEKALDTRGKTKPRSGGEAVGDKLIRRTLSSGSFWGHLLGRECSEKNRFGVRVGEEQKFSGRLR